MWLKNQFKKLFTKKLNRSKPNTKTSKTKTTKTKTSKTKTSKTKPSKTKPNKTKNKTLRKKTSSQIMLPPVSIKLNPGSMIEDIPNELKNNMFEFLNNTELSKVLETNKNLNSDVKSTERFSKYKKDKIQADEIKKYKGLWRPMKRNINKMTRKQIISDLKKFRDSWEEYPGINQDLSDENINDMITDDLLDRLHSYYSDDNKKNVEDIIDV